MKENFRYIQIHIYIYIDKIVRKKILLFAFNNLSISLSLKVY